MFYGKPAQHVEEMKKLAEVLVPFTPPNQPKDDDISWFKSREIVVDGIPIVAHYSVTDHKDYRPIVLTIGAKKAPFLPFGVVCKVARMFLGDEYLTLFEYTKGGSKIYSWMILLHEGEVISNNQTERASQESYNGFDFFRVDTSDEQEIVHGI